MNLNSENIDYYNSKIKIKGFEFACREGNPEPIRGGRKTFKYLAPEFFDNEKLICDSTIDTWPIGALVSELYTKETPFADMSELESAIHLRNERTLQINEKELPSVVLEFIRKCANSKINHRKSPAKLLKDDLFTAHACDKCGKLMCSHCTYHQYSQSPPFHQLSNSCEFCKDILCLSCHKNECEHCFIHKNKKKLKSFDDKLATCEECCKVTCHICLEFNKNCRHCQSHKERINATIKSPQCPECNKLDCQICQVPGKDCLHCDYHKIGEDVKKRTKDCPECKKLECQLCENPNLNCLHCDYHKTGQNLNFIEEKVDNCIECNKISCHICLQSESVCKHCPQHKVWIGWENRNGCYDYSWCNYINKSRYCLLCIDQKINLKCPVHKNNSIVKCLICKSIKCCCQIPTNSCTHCLVHSTGENLTHYNQYIPTCPKCRSISCRICLDSNLNCLHCTDHKDDPFSTVTTSLNCPKCSKSMCQICKTSSTNCTHCSDHKNIGILRDIKSKSILCPECNKIKCQICKRSDDKCGHCLQHKKINKIFYNISGNYWSYCYSCCPKKSEVCSLCHSFNCSHRYNNCEHKLPSKFGESIISRNVSRSTSNIIDNKLSCRICPTHEVSWLFSFFIGTSYQNPCYHCTIHRKGGTLNSINEINESCPNCKEIKCQICLDSIYYCNHCDTHRNNNKLNSFCEKKSNCPKCQEIKCRFCILPENECEHCQHHKHSNNDILVDSESYWGFCYICCPYKSTPCSICHMTLCSRDYSHCKHCFIHRMNGKILFYNQTNPECTECIQIKCRICLQSGNKCNHCDIHKNGQELLSTDSRSLDCPECNMRKCLICKIPKVSCDHCLYHRREEKLPSFEYKTANCEKCDEIVCKICCDSDAKCCHCEVHKFGNEVNLHDRIDKDCPSCTEIVCQICLKSNDECKHCYLHRRKLKLNDIHQMLDTCPMCNGNECILCDNLNDPYCSHCPPHKSGMFYIEHSLRSLDCPCCRKVYCQQCKCFDDCFHCDNHKTDKTLNEVKLESCPTCREIICPYCNEAGYKCQSFMARQRYNLA